MKTLEEGVLVVSKGDEPVAIVRRHASGHQVIYMLKEADAVDISDLISKAD